MVEGYSEQPFDEACSALRKELQHTAAQVRAMKNHPTFSEAALGVKDEPEMQANLALAYRHAEDAIMRLGKAIQAYDGGVSVYSK